MPTQLAPAALGDGWSIVTQTTDVVQAMTTAHHEGGASYSFTLRRPPARPAPIAPRIYARRMAQGLNRMYPDAVAKGTFRATSSVDQGTPIVAVQIQGKTFLESDLRQMLNIVAHNLNNAAIPTNPR